MPDVPATEWPDNDGRNLGHPGSPPAGQQWADQGGQGGSMSYGEEFTAVPTEFDHLFRGSTPDTRRVIGNQQPLIGGGPVSFQQAPVPAQQTPAKDPVYDATPQQGQYPPFPPEGYQGGG